MSLIHVNQASLQYPLYGTSQCSLKKSLIRFSTGRILLRILAEIYQPTTGHVMIKAQGLLHGLKKKAIKKIVPYVIEFTELEAFLPLPVKTYSSGMVLRLAFAITTVLKPEILLMDEAIGAGDAKFGNTNEVLSAYETPNQKI